MYPGTAGRHCPSMKVPLLWGCWRADRCAVASCIACSPFCFVFAHGSLARLCCLMVGRARRSTWRRPSRWWRCTSTLAAWVSRRRSRISAGRSTACRRTAGENRNDTCSSFERTGDEVQWSCGCVPPTEHDPPKRLKACEDAGGCEDVWAPKVDAGGRWKHGRRRRSVPLSLVFFCSFFFFVLAKVHRGRGWPRRPR